MSKIKRYKKSYFIFILQLCYKNEIMSIRTFKYSKNGNYRDLLRFLNSNDFQVCVYGHSCGLSDRVMLNEIFEHDYSPRMRSFDQLMPWT